MADKDNPLTEADYQYCVRILTQDSPLTQQELARCERMGLPIPQVADQDKANVEAARLIIKELWPHRMPQQISPTG